MTESKPLFPGYVFVQTNAIYDFVDQCHLGAHYPNVLGYEGGYSAISERELAVLDAIAGKENGRVAALSEGVIESGMVKVLVGPLAGCSGNIKKIDRHKRIAWVELPIMGRPVTVKMGLSIVSKT